MNALALFWVTDSISERSAGARSGVNATMEHPVYEMSSERASSHKGPAASIEEMVPVTHRQSRQSWLPMALDRNFRTLFSREPPTRETATIDVEVSSQPNRSLCSH